MKARILVIAVICGAAAVLAQTSINGGRAVTGTWDASAASSSKPAKTGSALPVSCSAGEQFFLTTAVPGSNLYLCATANQWSPALSPQTSQPANSVFAGPGSGNSGLPGFRRIVRADLPANLAGTDQSNVFTSGTQDLSGADATLPARVGASLPPTCTVGEFFFLSTATAGKNLNICYAADSWGQVSGGGGGGASGGPIASVGICNAGAAGQVYYPDDSPYTVWCNGMVWNYRLNGVAVNPPDNSAFSSNFQAGATVSVSGGLSTNVGDTYLTVPAGTNGSFRPSMRLMTNPYGTVWTLTAAFAGQPSNSAYGTSGASMGLLVRNTASLDSFNNAFGVLRAGFTTTSGSAIVQVQGVDSGNTVWTGGTAVNYMPLPPLFWLRLHANGTSLIGQYSADDGQNWYTIAQMPISSVTGTSGALSQLGWFVSPDNGLYPAAGALMHWSLVNH